jgi:hypothetical protein
MVSMLSVKQLRERAEKAGVPRARTEAARDGDDPKRDIIALIRSVAAPQRIRNPSCSLDDAERGAQKSGGSPLLAVEAEPRRRCGGSSIEQKLNVLLAVSCAALIMSTAALIMQCTTAAKMAPMADVMTRASEFIDTMDSAHATMQGAIATLTDEGRIKKTLTSAATVTRKIAEIDWELDPEADDDLCYEDTMWSNCWDRPQSLCGTGGDGYGPATLADGGRCAWDPSYGYCRKVTAWGDETYDDFFEVPTETCAHISAGNSDNIERGSQKIGDFLDELSGSLSSTVLPELEHAFDLNAEVTGLLNSDWHKIGGQCKSMMTKISEADLTDLIDLNLMEQNQADAFRAGFYTWGELCEKVEQGFA